MVRDKSKSPREAINLGIALVRKTEKRHGAMIGISIKNNINIPNLSAIQSAL